MNLIDVPNNALIRVKRTHSEEITIGKKIGQCTYVSGWGSTNPTFLVGILEGKCGTSIRVLENYPNYFTDDPPRYRDTKLFMPLEEIKATFLSCYWTQSTSACELVHEYTNQVCTICKIPAPHKAPNKDKLYICNVCEVQLSL